MLQEYKKAKTNMSVISQSFQLIWIEFGMLSDDPHTHFILYEQSLRGKEPC